MIEVWWKNNGHATHYLTRREKGKHAMRRYGNGKVAEIDPVKVKAERTD